MPSRKMARPWLRQLAVAAGYGAGYSLFHDVLLTQYSLSFGFRFAVLALTPYRYWSALLLGEIASTGYIAVTCAESFGALWALFRALPMMVLVMPVIRICREQLRLFSPKGKVSVSTLVFGTLAAALVTFPFEVGLLFLARLPANYPSPATWCFRFFLQDFVGALTVAPICFALKEALEPTPWRGLVHQLMRSRLFVESIGMFVPLIAFLMWIASRAAPDSEIRNIAQIAMFLPVVALSLRFGWHGAAVGGAGAGLAVEMLMKDAYDQSGMQAQTLIALAISTMLLMGKHVTALNKREQQEREGLRKALSAAQRNLHQSEHQMRRVAYALWDIQRTLYRMLRLGRQLAPAESIEYDQLARPLVHRLEGLARDLHPMPSQERSLPMALRESAIARVLANNNVGFHTELRGSLSALPFEMHLVLFRLIGDATTHLCDCHPVSTITAKVTSRGVFGRTWIWLRIEGLHVREHVVGYQAWHDLVTQLVASSRGRDFSTLDATARTFEGRARVRIAGGLTCVQLLLVKPLPSNRLTS